MRIEKTIVLFVCVAILVCSAYEHLSDEAKSGDLSGREARRVKRVLLVRVRPEMPSHSNTTKATESNTTTHTERKQPKLVAVLAVLRRGNREM
uniref:Uncharacterized protein n=1 Tax=Parascaris univalens TaxID=6257 RepID=A0A914ZJ46_PARUN